MARRSDPWRDRRRMRDEERDEQVSEACMLRIGFIIVTEQIEVGGMVPANAGHRHRLRFVMVCDCGYLRIDGEFPAGYRRWWEVLEHGLAMSRRFQTTTIIG